MSSTPPTITAAVSQNKPPTHRIAQDRTADSSFQHTDCFNAQSPSQGFEIGCPYETQPGCYWGGPVGLLVL
ncbi:hypothetical protein IAQ61_001521 [Plenodomus lingam]|uniref:uncharacterized protein n=1 Tax=Leptosphaeria maculans TaxID=5022 RepID=UPI00331BC41E|nr:hypothetical protein IAQ61_001521 [Plenodomus lingam]